MAIAHEYASWYTNGIDARKSTTDPAEMLATSTPNPTRLGPRERGVGPEHAAAPAR